MTQAELYAYYANDYESFDGVEVLTIIKTSDGSTVSNVKGSPSEVSPSVMKMFNNELIAGSDDMSAFILWDATLGGYEPQTGDIIRRPGGAGDWTLEAVARVRYLTQWLCILKACK